MIRLTLRGVVEGAVALLKGEEIKAPGSRGGRGYYHEGKWHYGEKPHPQAHEPLAEHEYRWSKLWKEQESEHERAKAPTSDKGTRQLAMRREGELADERRKIPNAERVQKLMHVAGLSGDNSTMEALHAEAQQHFEPPTLPAQPSKPTKTCATCDGRGKRHFDTGKGRRAQVEQCSKCGGSGRVADDVLGHTTSGKPVHFDSDAGKPGTTGDTIQRVAAAHPDFTADDHREASDMHQAAIGGAHGAAHADHMLAHDSAAQEKARARAGAPASAKPWGYHNGDKVQFSGTTRDVAGGTFHEFTYLEGHKKGQSGVTQHGPGSAMNPWPRTERPIEPEPAKKKPTAPAGTQLGLFKAWRLVLKAFGGGEGSRGGHIVGHTKGGHPIYAGAGLGGVDGHKPMPSLERHLARSYGKMHPVDHLREAHNHATMADDRARRNDHDAALHQAVLSDWHAGQAHAKSRGVVGGDHKPMLWNEEQIAEHARVKQAAADRDEAERAAASGGPHLVGRTSSGKGVYRTLDRERLTRGGTGAQAQHSWQNLHRHFTPDEHAEAAELHRNLAEQHRGDATLHSYHRMHATAHHEARAEQHERIAKDAKSRAAGGSKVARQVQLFHEKAASHARAEAGSPQFSMFKSVRLVLAAHRNAAGALILKAKAPTPLAPAPSPGAHVLGKTRSGKAVYASGAEVDGFTAQDHRDAAGLHQDAHAYHDARSGEHGDSAGRDPDWRRAESHTADADRHRKLADHHAELTRDHLIAGGHGGTAAIDVRALKPAPSDPEERAEAKQRFRGRKHRDYPGGATAYDRAQYRRRAA